jgi:hypothetical protein
LRIRPSACRFSRSYSSGASPASLSLLRSEHRLGRPAHQTEDAQRIGAVVADGVAAGCGSLEERAIRDGWTFAFQQKAKCALAIG